MVFKMTPDIEAKLGDMDDFELTLPAQDLFGDDSEFFVEALDDGERELNELYRYMFQYVGDPTENYGPGMSQLRGMVDDFGGKIWVSAAGRMDIKLQVRYTEERMRECLATLKDGLASEAASTGDATMTGVRVKEYLWKINFIERNLRKMAEKKGR